MIDLDGKAICWRDSQGKIIHGNVICTDWDTRGTIDVLVKVMAEPDIPGEVPVFHGPIRYHVRQMTFDVKGTWPDYPRFLLLEEP